MKLPQPTPRLLLLLLVTTYLIITTITANPIPRKLSGTIFETPVFLSDLSTLPSEQCFPLGLTATFNCTIATDSAHNLRIRWFVNGRAVSRKGALHPHAQLLNVSGMVTQPLREPPFPGVKQYTRQLSIFMSGDLPNESTIQCTAKNEHGTIKSAVRTLYHSCLPPVLAENSRTITQHTVELGGTAAIDCSAVSGFPEPKAILSMIDFAGKPIRHMPVALERRLRLYPYDAPTGPVSLKFLLTGLKREDTGRYVCQMTNLLGTVSQEHKVTVLEPPYFKEPLVEVTNGTVGDDITLRCHYGGTPEPEIKWMVSKNLSDAGHKMVDDSIPGLMVIRNATAEHSGMYGCFLSNSQGNLSGIFHVNLRPRLSTTVFMGFNGVYMLLGVILGLFLTTALFCIFACCSFIWSVACGKRRRRRLIRRRLSRIPPYEITPRQEEEIETEQPRDGDEDYLADEAKQKEEEGDQTAPKEINDSTDNQEENKAEDTMEVDIEAGERSSGCHSYSHHSSTSSLLTVVKAAIHSEMAINKQEMNLEREMNLDQEVYPSLETSV